MHDDAAAPWRRIAEHASDAIGVVADDGRIRWLNPAGCALLGYRLDELVDRPVTMLVGDDRDAVRALADSYAAARGGGRVIVERRLRRRDGSAVMVETSLSALGDGLVLVVARDVGERLAAGERLARSQRGFRALIEASPDGIVVHHQGRVVYANPAIAAMLGFGAPGELVGRRVTEFVHPDDRASVAERIRRLDHGEPLVPFTEERLLHRDGSVVVASIGALAIEFDGAPCVVAIARDVTEQRRLQARLVEADRMVALGTLSAGIAHEINNPLTYLLLHVEAAAAAAQRLAPMLDGDARALLDRLIASVAIAQDGAARVRDIVRDLRVFARATDDARAPIDLRHAVERALMMTAHELRDRATVVSQLAEVPRVIASDGRLTQVFVNLLINAAHAIGAGDPAHHRIEVRTWDDAGAACASVKDTGHGIAPELLPRIFDPFFTTKPVGEGSGLGLAICHGIVTAIGGTIAVESRVGEGSTFTVRVPGC